MVSPAKSDDAASLSSLDDAPLPAFPQYGRDGLLSAAFTGTTEVLKLMLALGPEAKLHKCDSLGNTPLHLAAFSGHHDAVVELLQTASVWHNMSDRATQAVQVDVMVRNGEDDTPLYMAVLCNNLDIVRLLAVCKHSLFCSRAHMFMHVKARTYRTRAIDKSTCATWRGSHLCTTRRVRATWRLHGSLSKNAMETAPPKISWD